MLEDISLSIVTFNNEDVIENVLDNILDNIHNKLLFKIYIIDNKSSDNTIQIIKTKYNHIDSINLIELNKNMGFGYGHNYVIDKLKSKYHVIVNPDITVESETFERLFNFMENNKDIALASPDILFPNKERQYSCKQDPTIFDLFIRLFLPNFFKKRQNKYMMVSKNYDEIFDAPIVSGCFMFIRTSIFKKINGFDKKYFLYFEDFDLCKKIRNINERIVYYPHSKVFHEWKRESRKSLKVFLIMTKSTFIFFNKWGYKFI